jgi:Amt family ammonium transporter
VLFRSTVFNYDDTLDCFGVHGVGSGMGVLVLSFFIRSSWMENASVTHGKTWTAFNQLMIQLTGMGATIALSVVMTVIICFVVQKTVGFRINEEGEVLGLDQALHGEHGYDFT